MVGENAPEVIEDDCTTCEGSGSHNDCAGSGVDDNDDACVECEGTGDCPDCGGSGSNK